MLFTEKAELWPRVIQKILWMRTCYTYPGIFHDKAYFQTDFLPLVRQGKLWDFNDSFYWWIWMFIVVLTIKKHRTWNISREKKAIYFISLHCMGQWHGNIFIFITISICLRNSRAQNSASLKKSRMTVKIGSWTFSLRCLFLFDEGSWLSNLLSTYALIVKTVKNIIPTQNFLFVVSFTSGFSRMGTRTQCVYF